MEMSESDDGEKLHDGAQRDRYTASIKAMQFELDLFWKRSFFFWGFIGAAFVAFASKQSSPPLQAAIASFGFVCSIVWTLVNRGSKYWYESWEKKVEETERTITGPLYANPKPEIEHFEWLQGRRYSPSKLAIALSDYTALPWLGLLIEKSAVLVSEQQWHIVNMLLHSQDWLTLIFVVFSFSYAIALCSHCHVKRNMKL
jgi:hypothetical protein